MAAASSTTYDALLRELWPQSDIYDELFTVNDTFYGMVQKDTSFYEKIRHIAVGISPTGGASASFSAAKANKQPTVQKEWKVTPVTYYSLFSIQRQLLRRAQNKKAAILPSLERETKGAMYVWKRRQGIYLANKSGIGDLGQISSFTNAVITLTAVADAKHFEAGMTLELSIDNTGSAGVKTTVVPAVVSKVDREAGTVTLTANVATCIPSAANSDYIYAGGDYGQIVSGIYAWVPVATPSATAFFGLDRTTEPQRLGGWRVNCKGLTPRGALKKTAKVIHENGGIPNKAWFSPNDFLNLTMELESAGLLRNVKEPGQSIGNYKFGMQYDGIECMGPAGPIKCFFDINVLDNYPVVSQADTWTFATMGDIPYFDTEDGNRILRETDADAYEGRIIGDFQLYNEAPGYNAIALLVGS